MLFLSRERAKEIGDKIIEDYVRESRAAEAERRKNYVCVIKKE